MPNPKRSLAPLLTLVALLAPVSVTDAQSRPEGALGMTPARRDITGRPPLAISPTVVRNTIQGPVRLRIYPALLRQALDGSFDIRDDAAALAAARRFYRLGEERATLAPGAELAVAERWLDLPPGLRGVGIGFVVEGTPRTGPGQPLQSVTRLVGLRLVKLPGNRGVRGRFSGLRGEQIAGPQLRFFSRVKNEGRVFAAPSRTRLLIRDASGRLVLRKRWETGIVLEDAEREYPVDVRKRLPAGVYEVTSEMTFGGKRRRITERVRLVGVNELPTIRARLSEVRGSAVRGERARVVATIVNTGTADLRPVLDVALFPAARGDRAAEPIARARRHVETVRPGRRLTVEVRPTGSLPAGDYQARVLLRADGRRLARESANFTATQPRSLWDRLRALVIPIAAALVLLALVFLVVRRRGRSGPGDGTVNVNTASVAELMSVDGIGRAAAERIVADRDEYGRFSSVDDLARVEGFDEERVRGLAGRLSA